MHHSTTIFLNHFYITRVYSTNQYFLNVYATIIELEKTHFADNIKKVACVGPTAVHVCDSKMTKLYHNH